ncbi:YbaB/EbfC family nucleoid-associated protein [Actinoplanes sp. TBRC 11911]|uniref:YbaB/EbfC family nucleoid-associated protein n=1 Tax=Actinoplanes sp. TBRC 11911 TaxID=2729386 RepID=UPI00145D1AD1|nr:YbaB/EbfC family nucleoid-associated protein [Actinoplanes sp. TBRC 11911]NMO54433.1 YbaB/EbfC family nucleoid-associated protein [Actinoplanes sp. TBRC 11911]
MAESDRDANRHLRDRLAEVYGRYGRLRSDMDELQRRLASLRVTVESTNGLVRATVGPRGQLVDLQLDRRRAPTMDSDRLARAILATVQEAARRSVDQVEELMAEYLPPESSALRALRDNAFGAAMRRPDANLTERDSLMGDE